MTVNSIKAKNVAVSDIVKVKAGDTLIVKPVARVTKTQIMVSVDGETFRFRRVDGKEVSSNGKVVDEGATLKLNDILRFND